MFVCMCVFLCVYIYAHVCVFLCVCIYAHMCVCACVHVSEKLDLCTKNAEFMMTEDLSHKIDMQIVRWKTFSDYKTTSYSFIVMTHETH